MITMSNYCKIGPITLDNPHLTTEWQPEYTGNEKFRVKAPHPQSLQLTGLVSKVNIDENGPRKRIAILNGWGVLPVDAAEAIVNNDRLRPRGYYVLTDYLPAPRHGSPHVTGALELEKLSDNLSDYLQVDYTSGINDGTNLSTDYPSSDTTLFSDGFSTLDTSTVWNTPVSTGLTANSYSISSNKLLIVGAASVAGTWGGQGMLHRSVFDAPFEMVFPLEWVSLTANYHSEMGVYLYTYPFSSGSQDIDHFRILIQMSSTVANWYVQSRYTQTWITHASGPLTVSEKTPIFKVRVDENQRISVWIDKTGTGGDNDWTNVVANLTPSMPFPDGYYLAIRHATNSTTSRDHKMDSILLTREDTAPLNIVTTPVGSMVETPTFTRASADGNIPCYAGPTYPLPYTISFGDFYKGTVKAWNTNFTDSTARLVTSDNMVLLPTKFYVDNGLIRLNVTATGVEFYYYNGSSYVLLDTLVTGTVNVLKIIECDPMKVTFQLNRMKWTLEAGKPFCRVVHPETVITYTRSATGCYYHDATTTDSPAAGADITMATQNYTTIWSKGSGTCASPNPAQNYRLMVIKQNTDTIKSDSLPASAMTGIGWVDNTQTAGSYKDAPSIAKEFMTRTMQMITLEG